MTTRTHPFRQQTGAASYQELAVFWLLRAFTYIILGFGALIFAVIIWRGAPAVLGSFRVDDRVPFIHNDFLFTAPQTLHVFKYKGETRQMSADQFYAFTAARPPVPATAPLAAPAAPSANATPAPAPMVNPNDITDHETYNYAAGGIWPQIVGTVLLVIGSMTIALVLGVFSAIYLSEYSRQGPVISAIRLAIINLAGVPSIVFGLFGVALFVNFFGWNISMLAGWFTLAFMVLPVIITASEESLRAVPQGFREGSLALGATQVADDPPERATLRAARHPHLLGARRGARRRRNGAHPLHRRLRAFRQAALGILREPAIILRPVFSVSSNIPLRGCATSVLHPVNALPYHIYVVSSKIPQNEYTERVQYGTAFVFLAVVMAIAMASVVLRVRLRRRLKW